MDCVVKLSKQNINLQRQIGTGSYSNVYLATFRRLPLELEELKGLEHVAVKVAKRKVNSRENVWSEIVNMAKMKHPNIVGIIGSVDCGRGVPWLVLEFMPNGTVFDVISTAEVLEENVLLRMMSDIASGMDHLHNTLNMVHGDLHSQNCFVGTNGITKVGDFGFTCRSDSDFLQRNPYDSVPPRVLKAALLKHCTRSTTAKFNFFPPEYLLTQELDDLVTHKAGDVWSYGTLVFQIWAKGNLPFENLTPAQIHAAFVSGIDPFEFIEMPVPAPVLTLTLNCWEYKPQKRPTFSEILNTLSSNFELQK